METESGATDLAAARGCAEVPHRLRTVSQYTRYQKYANTVAINATLIKEKKNKIVFLYGS